MCVVGADHAAFWSCAPALATLGVGLVMTMRPACLPTTCVLDNVRTVLALFSLKALQQPTKDLQPVASTFKARCWKILAGATGSASPDPVIQRQDKASSPGLTTLLQALRHGELPKVLLLVECRNKRWQNWLKNGGLSHQLLVRSRPLQVRCEQPKRTRSFLLRHSQGEKFPQYKPRRVQLSRAFRWK